MTTRFFSNPWVIGLCALALFAALLIRSMLGAPQTTFFDALDANRDGAVSRDEFTAAVAKWLPSGSASASESQLTAAMDPAFPGGLIDQMLAPTGPQNQTAKASDVEKMMAALPVAAPAKPARPRRVLVLSKCAGFVHSCIPLAARTIEELGKKTGAWTATVSYDAADINAANLKQYDLVFLNNTTGHFLDDANPSVTAARKKALIEFVRGGKGLAGIHAASDSYHGPAPGSPGLGAMLGGLVLAAADTDRDKAVTAAELRAFSGTVYDRMDLQKTGKLSVPELRSRFLWTLFGAAAGRGPAGPQRGRPGRDTQIGTWPDFNTMIGGFFKYHWNDPTHIVYKIDDPDSPLTAMFKGDYFAIDDETYTFGVNTWSRKNLRVLTSVDYSKMSEEDKLKEDYPREDHDYGLSWIRSEGKGRVFYAAHGHNERVYAIRPFLEHVLAGTQYALGDLKANDAPSSR